MVILRHMSSARYRAHAGEGFGVVFEVMRDVRLGLLTLS